MFIIITAWFNVNTRNTVVGQDSFREICIVPEKVSSDLILARLAWTPLLDDYVNAPRAYQVLRFQTYRNIYRDLMIRVWGKLLQRYGYASLGCLVLHETRNSSPIVRHIFCTLDSYQQNQTFLSNSLTPNTYVKYPNWTDLNSELANL